MRSRSRPKLRCTYDIYNNLRRKNLTIETPVSNFLFLQLRDDVPFRYRNFSKLLAVRGKFAVVKQASHLVDIAGFEQSFARRPFTTIRFKKDK